MKLKHFFHDVLQTGRVCTRNVLFLFLKRQLKFLPTTENGKFDFPALQIVNYLHGTITYSLDEL